MCPPHVQTAKPNNENTNVDVHSLWYIYASCAANIWWNGLPMHWKWKHIQKNSSFFFSMQTNNLSKIQSIPSIGPKSLCQPSPVYRRPAGGNCFEGSWLSAFWLRSTTPSYTQKTLRVNLLEIRMLKSTIAQGIFVLYTTHTHTLRWKPYFKPRILYSALKIKMYCC